MTRTQSIARWFARIVGALLFVLYPLLVWWGLSRGSARLAALVILAVAAPVALVRMRGAHARAARSLAIIPLITVVMLLAGAALNEAGFVLVVPTLINTAMLVAFGSTLRAGAVPMIERFARLQIDDPSDEQKAWCRAWTRIWCVFFAVNATTAAVLALAAPLSWWAFYNGLVAYVVIGALLATEWVMRVRRFGRA